MQSGDLVVQAETPKIPNLALGALRGRSDHTHRVDVPDAHTDRHNLEYVNTIENIPMGQPLPDAPLPERLEIRSVGRERFNDIAMPVKTWYDDDDAL
jgi:hypothetical protein